MKLRCAILHRTNWSLGMIALLVMTVLAPMAGGFLQQQHRRCRQANLRRNRVEHSVIRLLLTENVAKKCYNRDKHELFFEGLQYDVLAIQRQGKRLRFEVVPDVKETMISSLTLKNILFPAGESAQKSSWAGLYFLYLDAADLPLFYPVSMERKIVFAEQRALEMAGFGWCFVPPPDANQV